jgi:beta-exotoxin I transport system permease protein
MLRSVATKTLRDLRRGLLWWSLGLIGMVALVVSVYPSVHKDESLNKVVEDLPEGVKNLFAFGGQLDLTSPAGYIGGRLFSFLVPVLLLVAAVGAGARAIAGEEEAGTLDLLLANPISRRRVALEKLGALATELVVLGAVLWLTLVGGTRAVDMEIGVGRLAAATLDVALLAVGFGAIALACGALTGRRGLAGGVSGAAAVAGYLVNSLAPLVGFLEPLQKASPFYHASAGDPLRHGLAVGHTAFLLAVAVIAGAAGVVFFDRRDLIG